MQAEEVEEKNLSNQGKKKKYSTRTVATKFGCSMRTVQRIWDRADTCIQAGLPVNVGSFIPLNCGLKRLEADLTPLASIPLNERSTIRSACEKLGMAILWRRREEANARSFYPELASCGELERTGRGKQSWVVDASAPLASNAGGIVSWAKTSNVRGRREYKTVF